jgi:hypothetical protein
MIVKPRQKLMGPDLRVLPFGASYIFPNEFHLPGKSSNRTSLFPHISNPVMAFIASNLPTLSTM